MSQAVTHAPKSGEGEKVSLDTLILVSTSPTPESTVAHEGFYSEFRV